VNGSGVLAISAIANLATIRAIRVKIRFKMKVRRRKMRRPARCKRALSEGFPAPAL
jgi:hypothetical protein